jgi:hypothetical protein
MFTLVSLRIASRDLAQILTTLQIRGIDSETSLIFWEERFEEHLFH